MITSYEIIKLCDFIKDEISPYDINFEYEIEHDILYAKFNGHFTSNKDIELRFRVYNTDIEVYGLCESYIFCGTREFWIELMGRLI